MQQTQETVALRRDVVAALIPAGQKVELPEGAQAVITQALGGSYTIVVEGHMFRIEGKDADALGKETAAAVQVAADAPREDVEKAMWAQLRTCYDPEIPVDIVELGLVYECRLEDLPEQPAGAAADPASAPAGGLKAVVRMTLTAPGCGMGDYLVGDVKSKLQAIPGIREADVQLVFEPPWTRERMSESAQLALGMM